MASVDLPKSLRRVPWARVGLVGALASVLLFAPELAQSLGRSPEQMGMVTEGYSRIVNELMASPRRKWIVAEYNSRGEVKLEVDPRVAAIPEVRDFIAHSYLRNDLTDPAIWRFSEDGSSVEGMDPFAHAIPEPFEADQAWHGDLVFREGYHVDYRLTQLGSDRHVDLVADGDPTRDCDIDRGMGRWPASGSAQRSLGVCRTIRGAAGAQDHVVELARITRVGNRALIRAVTPPTNVTLKLGGAPLRPAAGLGTVIRVFKPGETLEVSDGGRRTVYVLDEVSSAISAERPLGQSRERIASLAPFARGVEASLPGLTAPGHPLRLSLDRDLQEVAQQALDTSARRLRSRDGEAFRAAATIMDGQTGEVLAMASWPYDEGDLSPPQRRTRSGRALIERNHNLSPMPIGSVAKVPFSAAILHHAPNLASFRLAPGPSQSLMGVDLGRSFDDHGGDGLIGFSTFISTSSNHYGLGLMLLALADPTPVELPCVTGCEPWSLDGRLRTDTPNIIGLGGQAPTPFGRPIAGLTSPSQPAWSDSLVQLFDVQHTANTCPYNIGVWRSLMSDVDCQGRFAQVSPEREALGLSAISRVAEDYLMSILGGARSSWTTIKVAEVFSRIVGGQLVKARFTPVSHEEGDAPPLDEKWFDADHQDARFALLQGLQDTVGGVGGTATALRGSTQGYPPGVRLFVKTGTPNIAGGGRLAPANTRLQELLAGACGLRRSGSGTLYFDAGGASPQTARQTARGLDRLAGAQCLRAGDDQKRLVQEMARYDCRSPAECVRKGVVFDTAGRVTKIPVRRTADQELAGTGHGVAVVIALYDPNDSRLIRPTRVLTIVVNIQNRNGDRPGLSVADAVIRSEVVRDWLWEGLERAPL